MQDSKKLETFLDKHFSYNDREQRYKDSKLYSIELEVTNQCNAFCPYCYNSSSIKLTPISLSLEKCTEVLEYAYSVGVRCVWWLGGEPLLNKDIFNMLSTARNIGIKENVLFTNGLKLNNNFICEKVVELVDILIFHLDTIDKHEFANMHIKATTANRNYSFYEDLHTRMVKGIAHLLSYGFDPMKVRHNITLSKSVLDSFEQTIKWGIKEMGFSMATLIPMFSCGRGLEIESNTFLTLNEIESAFKIRAQVEGRPELLLLGPSEYCKQYQLTTCCITSKGDVLPYAGIDTVVGNVYEKPFDRIFNENMHTLMFKDVQTPDLRNVLEGKCSSCENQKYCFGTRTVAYRNGKGIHDSDPTCWI